MFVSDRLVARVRLSKLRAYEVAHLAGVHPTTLSKLINGIELPKPNDARVIAVGRVVGLSAAECFRLDIEGQER